jgi:hypothetical protein
MASTPDYSIGFTDPDTGLTFGYLRYTEIQSNRIFVTVECIYGFKVALAAGIQRIVQGQALVLSHAAFLFAAQRAFIKAASLARPARNLPVSTSYELAINGNNVQPVQNSAWGRLHVNTTLAAGLTVTLVTVRDSATPTPNGILSANFY